MKIDRFRARIDATDKKLVKLLNDRAHMAVEIGKIKHREGLPVFAPDREEKVLRAVEELSARLGNLSPEAIRAIFSEVISACRSAERKIVVAFLGPRGTFSEKAANAVKWNSLAARAAKWRFGSQVEMQPMGSIDAVFAEVAGGRADYGVVPIENSTEGGIGATLDMFMESDLKVCAEVQVRVHHALLARCKPEKVRRIYSKAEIFGQCKSWLANQYPGAALIDVASSTHAAELASRHAGAAAVANEENAERFGLQVLHRAIEDNPFNITRFYVVGQAPAPRTGRDKTSLLCFIKDQPGALHELLLPFQRSRVNLTKIESWPSKRKAWDYCFFIDFEGHRDEPKIARTLAQVRKCCSELKILGSFPAAR